MRKGHAGCEAESFSSFYSRHSHEKLFIGIYLSFFNKKDLTNGVGGFILCAMNANEISAKNNSQVNRIRKVSVIFRVICFAVFVLSFLSAIGTCGAIFIAKGSPLEYEFIATVGMEISVGIWAWFCYKLFNLCSLGDLFTSKVVFYIRRIGYAYFLMALMNFVSRIFAVHSATAGLPATKIDVEWQLIGFGLLAVLAALIPGFLILFIAWIMDEGRKIQEEQELTV
ncbi:MAG TPA: DUF2975 domain-containing protein [Verrucomicrobiae bacterium]